MEYFHRPDRVIIATGNKGKIAELQGLLRPIGIKFLTLRDVPRIPEPEEIGSTFRENAELKAAYYARETGEWSVADDSGLMVDQLGGRPGILSARYGGVDTSYADKMTLLLNELQDLPELNRSAQFMSYLALADPSGSIRVGAEGICRGRIADSPRGTNGFGYDPIFLPDGFTRTFGEMTDEEKSSLSHRSRAAIQFIGKMSEFTGV